MSQNFLSQVKKSNLSQMPTLLQTRTYLLLFFFRLGAQLLVDELDQIVLVPAAAVLLSRIVSAILCSK